MTAIVGDCLRPVLNKNDSLKGVWVLTEELMLIERGQDILPSAELIDWDVE